MKYRICPDCGEHLDFGEIHHCEGEKNENPSAATEEPSIECLASINTLSQLPSDVNSLLHLKEVRSVVGAQAKDMAEVVKRKFPKFSRQLFAQCEYPAKYGIVIHPDGLRLLCKTYGVDVKDDAIVKVHKDHPRTKPVHLSLRMTDDDYEKLHTRVCKDGYPSVQAWLYDKVMEILNDKEAENG